MAAISPIGANQSASVVPMTSTQKSNDMFLKLLVAEMGAQNPMEPMDNQSFMEQLSQFSAMEKTSEMNENLADLLQFQGVLAAMQGLEKGASLLGKIVEFKDEAGNTGSGEVKSARIEGTEVILDLGTRTISIGDVQGVRQKEVATTTAATAENTGTTNSSATNQA